LRARKVAATTLLRK